MHILFIYSQQNTVLLRKPLRGQEEVSFGISYIASLLEQHDHSCELLVLNSKNSRQNEKIVKETISWFKPGLICFTAVFSEYDYISAVAAFIKLHFPCTFLLLGGIHITLNPDAEALQVFDALCIGEGEYAVLDLVNCLEEKKPVAQIPNLWIKTPSGIEKNNTRPYIGNLDLLPFPNRRMWQPWVLNPNTRLTVLLGRGCPFNCTYCSNHKLRKVSEGEYVRLRSAGNIIEEIEILTSEFPEVNDYVLEVETLGTDAVWLSELCEALYRFNTKREVPLTFSSNLRIHPHMDFKNIFNNLKRANFQSIVIGLESGSENIRAKVLNRFYSNNDVLLATRVARENNIRVGIFNLVGLPEESPEDFSETLKMNQQIQPDWHATSIFFPYPGTALYAKVSEMGLLPTRLSGKDERQIARISYPAFHKKQIQIAFDRFHYEVYKHHPHQKKLKSAMYLLQIFLGHNNLAKAKLSLIRMLYFLHLDGVAKKTGLFGVFQ